MRILFVRYIKQNRLRVELNSVWYNNDRLEKIKVAILLIDVVQERRLFAVNTVRKHLRGRIIWWTMSGNTRVSHRTSASIAPNPSRGRNIWQITCVNTQANRHTDATSAPSHLLVRSIWRIMCESTPANHRIGVNSARERSPGKNI